MGWAPGVRGTAPSLTPNNTRRTAPNAPLGPSGEGMPMDPADSETDVDDPGEDTQLDSGSNLDEELSEPEETVTCVRTRQSLLKVAE